MRTTTIRGIDVTSPTFAADLIAFHRRTFGDARMEEAPAAPPAAPAAPPAAPPAPAPAPAATPPAPAPQEPAGQKVEDLPDWAQKIINDARADAGKARTTAKQQAADEAKAELAQAVGKALGIVKDDKEQVDPAKLAEQVSAAQAAQRESAAELVVWRNATDLKVDAQAVTDSRAFARAIASLDPSSKTFEADVKKAAQEAAENNPKLKAARAAGRSSVNHAGGSGEDADPATRSLPGQARMAAAYASNG